MKKNIPFLKNKYVRFLIPVILFVISAILIIEMTSTIAAGMFQILLLLFGVYLISRGLKEPYIFNPYLFFAICPLTLALYFPKISEYYLLELSISTHFYALINMFMFYFGMEITKRIKLFHGKQELFSSYRWSDSIRDKDVANWSLFFSIIGFLPAAYALIAGTLAEWNNLKVYASSFPIYAIIAYFPYIGIALAIFSGKKSVKTIAILLGGIATLVSLTKTMVMFFLIAILFAVERVNKGKGIKKLMILGCVALMLFSVLDEVYNVIRNATQYEQLWLSRSSDILTVSQLKTYLYFETPWCNLEYILSNFSEHSYGLWTLKPVLTLLRVDVLFADVYTSLEPYTTFNALGYLIYLYHDFGYLGSCIAVMLLGCFVSFFYEKGKVNRNPFLAIIVMMVLRAVMMMFFNLHFNTEIYVLVCIILMLLVNWIGRRKNYVYMERKYEN